MKNAKLILSLVVLVVLIGFGIWAYHHVAFSFANFRAQLQHGRSGRKIAIGLGCIYLGYVFRAIRWALLIGQQEDWRCSRCRERRSSALPPWR